MVNKLKDVLFFVCLYVIGWMLGSVVLWAVWNLGAVIFGFGGITFAQAALVGLLADFLFMFLGKRVG